MAQENKNPIWLEPQVALISGSTPRDIEALRRSISGKNNGTNPHESNECVLFDSRRTVSVGNHVLSDKEQDANELFSSDEFVDAVLPKDAASLARHEEEGTFSRMAKDWYKSSEAALDDYGAGGQQSTGYTMARVVKKGWLFTLKKVFGRCVDHGKRLLGAIKDSVANEVVYRILVHVRCSAVGGMGSGAVIKMPDYVQEVTADYQIIPKLILDILLRGDLPVKDQSKADINQVNLLKYVRALASGEYVDPITGNKVKNPFDNVFLQSNQNCHGRFASLEQLLIHEAYRQNIMWNSSLSLKVRERLVDIENVSFDKYGDPLIGYSASVSGIRRDNGIITDYCADRAIGMIADALARKPDTGQAQSDALAFARMHGVIESQDESHLTSRILTPAEFNGENSIQRLASNFAARIKGSWGIGYARALAETITSIKGVEFASNYEPAMTKDALKKNNDVITALDEAIRQRSSAQTNSQDSTGSYSDIPALLAGYKRVLAVSIQAVTGKVGPLQEASQLHQDAVNQALSQLAQVDQMSWWGRLWHFFLIREIASCLEESGLAWLTLELQILVCKVASHVLDKQMEYVDGNIMRFTVLDQDLRHISAASKQRAQRLTKRKTGYDAAPFFELENQGYLENFFTEKVVADGGEDVFTGSLIARLVKKHGSLSILPGKDAAEVENIFKDVCREVFEPITTNMDVVTEFKKVFPDPKKQIKIMRSLILQSEGSVHTVGEAGTDVVWLKFVTVPTEDDVKWMREVIEKADPKAGIVEITVDGDSTTIKILQLRGGISLSPLIAKNDLTEPDDWEKMVAYAVDRTTAIMGPPNPTNRQLRMVIAKAIVTGQLIWDDHKGFGLSLKDHGEIWLAHTAADAAEKLRRCWQYLVRIESTFTHHVFLNDIVVTNHVENLDSELTSKITTDGRISLIDATAVSDVKKQLELLIPWTKRLHVGVRKVS
jgi:hypothetical protein